MAQRITITIPDDLYDRLHVVKEKINVSQASCQGGIMNAVQLEEIKAAAIPDKEKLLAKLRLQREESITGLRDAGEKAGISDAASMDYDDFIAVAAVYENLHSADGDSFSPYEELRDSVIIWLEDELNDREKKFGKFDWEVYLRGWVDGVMGVWSGIKDEL